MVFNVYLWRHQQKMMNKREIDEREECINLGIRTADWGHMVYVYKNFQEKMYFSFIIQYQEVIRKCFKLKFSHLLDFLKGTLKQIIV